MKSWLSQAAFNVRHSYWFIPSLMALGAVLMAAGMVALDIYYLREVPKGYEWLFRSQPSGARAILSTVAGSTITVAGVVFSMTIMAVSHATSNYGSRLLLKFLKDRRNQFALGTFTATFIYCLLVLRTVSDAESGSQYADFVPHIAILGALGLALASVAVLISFIHHVPDTIHVGDVAADRGQELIERLDSMFTAEPERAHAAKHSSRASTFSESLKSPECGYLQSLDVSGLKLHCVEQGLFAKVVVRPGDFIVSGQPMLKFNSETPDSELDHDVLQSFFGIGLERTPAQDLRFLIEELNQIAIRALSPGINDPFTASTCIDWLGAATAHICNKYSRSPAFYDDGGLLRLTVPDFDFERFCAHVYDQLRPYAVCDALISVHMAGVFQNIMAVTANQHNRAIIGEHAAGYLREALVAIESKTQREELRQRFAYIEH